MGAAAMTYATGYIYAAGGSGLPDFRLVNEVVFGVISLLVLVVAIDVYADCMKERAITSSDEGALPETQERITMDVDNKNFEDGKPTLKRKLTTETFMSEDDIA